MLPKKMWLTLICLRLHPCNLQPFEMHSFQLKNVPPLLLRGHAEYPHAIGESSIQCSINQLQGRDTISRRQLIWGKDPNLPMQNVILAADCLYMLPSVKPFWKTVASLLHPTGMLICVMESSSQATFEQVVQSGTRQQWALMLRVKTRPRTFFDDNRTQNHNVVLVNRLVLFMFLQ